jgi:hypothetical protein
VSLWRGSFAPVAAFGLPQWGAGGIVTVFAGIWIATTTRPVRPKSQIEIARLDTQT